MKNVSRNIDSSNKYKARQRLNLNCTNRVSTRLGQKNQEKVHKSENEILVDTLMNLKLTIIFKYVIVLNNRDCDIVGTGFNFRQWDLQCIFNHKHFIF